MKLPSIQQMFLEASKAAGRFPFVLLCALAVVSAALILIDSEPFRSSSTAYPILLSAMIGIPLLLALALCAEKRRRSSGFSLGIQLLGVLLLVGYGFSVPTALPQSPASHFIRFGLLLAGSVLLTMILPYLKKGEMNGFWQYNKAIFFRLFVTAVFAVVLYIGLSIALTALRNLFGVPIPGKRYGELWVLVAGLFAPWFFLSGVPKDLDGLDQIEEYPKGLRIFSQYILLSLVIVYFLILYAYLLKILLQWSWPKGWVSGLILGFSAVSMLALLIMHPIRDRSGNTWMRAAGKWLYIVLIPLIVVLFLAVTERIGDYGITESRYAGIALGLWLSAQVLYFLFGRSKSIKFTIGSLCLIAFLVSFGPWGMLHVSERSQVTRLSRLLTKNGILVNGKVHKEHQDLSAEDVQDINSIVDYLNRIHNYDAIQPWFSEKLKEDTQRGNAQSSSAADVLSKMAVSYIASSGFAGSRQFTLDELKTADISGYDRIVWPRFVNNNPNMKTSRYDVDNLSYEVSDNLRMLTIKIGNSQTGIAAVQVDIGSFTDALFRKYGNADFSVTNKMTPDSMAIVTEQGGQKVKIIFKNMLLVGRSGKMQISSFNAYIAYTVPK
jgi:hypothetical protein